MPSFEAFCDAQFLGWIVVNSTFKYSCPHESQHGSRTYPSDHNKPNMADLMGCQCQIRFFQFVLWITFLGILCSFCVKGLWDLFYLTASMKSSAQQPLGSESCQRLAMCNYLTDASFLSQAYL